MKVFISFSTDDRKTAVSLYDDLRSAGADVFRYGESETVGTPTWPEILEWIGKSDVFILLVSKSALRSQAVREEVDHAHYRYINSEQTNPSKLVPAILEKGAEPPMLIERFSQVDLQDYKVGREKLLEQLGLDEAAPTPKLTDIPPASLYEPILDFDKIRADSGKSISPPAEQQQWTKDALTMLSNYQMLKPVETSKEEAADHIDGLLADYSGKNLGTSPYTYFPSVLDTWFLGVPAPPEPAEEEASTSAPNLSSLLLNYDPIASNQPLEAPVLGQSDGILNWNEVTGAVGYVVEESTTADFSSPKEVYRGALAFTIGFANPWASPLRLFAIRDTAAYYRVKATGGVFRADSPWSASVKREPRLLTPTLTATAGNGGTSLAWTTTAGASGYVLEWSPKPSFDWPVKLYEGDQTSHFDVGTLGSGFVFMGSKPLLSPWTVEKDSEPAPISLGANEAPQPPLFQVGYYRVKATSVLRADSFWSEVVEVKP